MQRAASARQCGGTLCVRSLSSSLGFVATHVLNHLGPIGEPTGLSKSTLFTDSVLQTIKSHHDHSVLLVSLENTLDWKELNGHVCIPAGKTLPVITGRGGLNLFLQSTNTWTRSQPGLLAG